MKVCIICEKEPQGQAYAVADDAIVKAIRSAKQKLGIARNNELFVCQQCLPSYKEKRKKFEKNLVFYVAAAVVVFVLINALQLLYGAFNLFTLIASVFLALLLCALPVLNYATPPLEGGIPETSAQSQAQPPAAQAPTQQPVPQPQPQQPVPQAQEQAKTSKAAPKKARRRK